MRNSDSHILFIGRTRFTHEDRYELVPSRYPQFGMKKIQQFHIKQTLSHLLCIDDDLRSCRHGRWTLKLKYVGARDAGRFECQVSTQPKISRTFSLKVVGE